MYQLRPVQDVDTRKAKIGEGAYAKVYRSNDGAYAIKRIPINHEYSFVPIREMAIMRRLVGQEGIIEIIDAFAHSLSGRWDTAIVIPYYKTTLNKFYETHKYDKNYPLHANCIMKCISIGLYNMHRLGFLHLDIKPANIMVDENNLPKLIDFGITKYVGNITKQQPYSDVITVWYKPPELLRERTYNHLADVWSLGCCFGELVYGKPLFPGSTNGDMEQRHKRRDYRKGTSLTGMDEWTELVELMLQDNRIDISDVLIRMGNNVDPVVQANMDHISNHIIKYQPHSPDHSDIVNYIIMCMRLLECHPNTMAAAITLMDIYEKDPCISRCDLYMALAENLYEPAINELKKWGDPSLLMTRMIHKFQNMRIDIPLITHFIPDDDISNGLALLLLYGEYQKYSFADLGDAITRFIANEELSDEPTSAMTYLLNSLETVSASMEVFAMYPGLRLYLN
jgi:serine/threonine protein kinase